MNAIFLLIVFATGAAGIAAQVFLLRELLVNFSGNELSIGVILSNWVLAEAAGVVACGLLAEKIKSRMKVFIGLQAAFFLFLFASLYFSRTFKGLLGIGFGEAGGPGLVFFSFVITFFPALIHGGLFSMACSIYSSIKLLDGRSIGKVYAWETFGTLAGGLLLAYFFIPLADSFSAAYFLSVAVFLMCLALGVRSGIRLLHLVFAAAVFLCYLSYGGRLADHLEKHSLLRQWSGYDLLESRNSVYGNIAVTRQPGQYTFYYDGRPVIYTPNPDRQFVNDLGNLPLAFLPEPKDVLVIGSGAGGLLAQVLRHNVTKVDYAEMDPELIRSVRRYPTELTSAEFADRRVRLISLDGRFFLRSAKEYYDVIIVGLAEAADLAANRMFTSEFYRLADSRLRPAGIMCFWLPRQETYMGREELQAQAAIFAAFKNNYRHTRLIPADYYTLFIGSRLIKVQETSADTLRQRLSAQGLESSFPPAYLDYLLAPERAKGLFSLLSRAPAPVNRDRRPVAVFDLFMFQSKKFFQAPSWLIYLAGRSGPYSVCIFVFVLFLIFAAAIFRRSNNRRPVYYCVATSGFFGMLSSLLLMFSFQTNYGYVFSMLSVFIAVFMFGAGMGGVLISRRDRSRRAPAAARLIFVGIEAAIIIFCLLLGYLTGIGAAEGFILWEYGLFFFIPGLFVGAQFALAVSLLSENRPQAPGRTSGVLYGADLAGGWLAGAAGGVILLPVAGIFLVCLLMSLLKVSSLTWFVMVKNTK